MQVNIYEAKTRFSQLVEAASKGETVLIAKAGTPLAKLAPLEPVAKKITLGLMKNDIVISGDFDAPLPDAVLGAFEGEAVS